MFRKLEKLIEQEGIGEREEYEPHLKAIRIRKKVISHSLFSMFLDVDHAMLELEGGSIEFKGFKHELKNRMGRDSTSSPDFGPTSKYISELAKGVYQNPNDDTLAIIQSMLLDEYQPPNDDKELLRHLFALVTYYSLDSVPPPILLDLRIDISSVKLASKVGVFNMGVQMAVGEEQRAKGKVVKAEERKELVQKVLPKLKQLPNWSMLSKDRRAEIIGKKILEQGGKKISKKTIKRKLEEIGEK